MKYAFTYLIGGVPNIPRLILILFMLTTLLAPVTILNKILFFFLMLWIVIHIFRIRHYSLRLSLPAFGVISIFFYGLLVSFLGRSDSNLALQFFLATFVLLLVSFVDHYCIDMDKASELCGKAMLALTMLYWTLLFNQDLPYANKAFEWINEISSSATAQREFIEGGFTLTLALGTVPFLFVPWCIISVRLIRNFRITDLLWLLLYGVAMGLSGARGLVVIALIFLVVALFWLKSNHVRIFMIAALMVIFTIVVPVLIDETVIFSGQEISNSIKIGHFNSFVNNLGIFEAIYGEGLASYYFSSGRGSWMAHTELTPIDLARYLGIPFAIIVYGLLLFPIKDISGYKGDNFLFSFGFFLFLALSMTNPTLINSYGMLVVVWYWTKIRRSAQRPLPITMHQSHRANANNVSGEEF